jgi:microcystin-dependent protein
VGEDSASCKYTVPTFNSNSLLSYNASTGLVNWADGSASNPIFLGNGNQASSSTVGAIQGTTPTGQLVEFNPSTSTETQFPIVSPSGVTTAWGTIENIVPSQGLVYRPSVSGTLGSVAQLTGSSGQVVSFDANGNPYAVAANAITGTSVPSGAVLPFAYNVTSGIVPAGWLLCDGSVYTTAVYPTLGALLGNTYGGSTGTFAVPNLSGLFIRGTGTQTSGGVTYSAGTIGTIQSDAFQGHYHSSNRIGGNYGFMSGGSYVNEGLIGTNTSGSGGTNGTFGPTTDGTNGTPRTGTETRPVNLAMVYCIKI